MNPDGPQLRQGDQTAGDTAAGGGTPLPTHAAVNPTAELVADFLAATNLLTEDKLNVVRGAAGQGSIAEAIVEQGFAPSEGVAKLLASRHHMPVVDLAVSGIDGQAAETVPLHV